MEVKREEDVVSVKVEDSQEDSQYACPVCGKRFMYTFTLGRHMVNCANVKVEVCRGSDDGVVSILDSSEGTVFINNKFVAIYPYLHGRKLRACLYGVSWPGTPG